MFKHCNISKKSFYITIIGALFMILCSLAFIYFYNKNNNNIITTSMQFEYLGYNEYYNNSDDENLTVLEASKILTSIYAKIYDISELSLSDNLDEAWMEYASNLSLITDNEQNYNLTYIRLFRLLYEYYNVFNIEKNENIDNVLNLDEKLYSNIQIKSVNFLYKNGVVNDIILSDDIIQTSINKKSFEDIIAKYIFKFNLIDLGDNTIDYEKSLNISQGENYFFVTNNIDTSELKYKTLTINESQNYIEPKNSYSKIRNDIYKMSNAISGYFDTILNVNYNEINYNTFYNNIKNYCVIDYETVENYCNYVVDNQIQITGKVKIISPIVYNIDDNYYVRAKLDFNIQHSNVNDNIIFGNIDKSTKIIDVKMQRDNGGWVISTIYLNSFVIK